MATLTPTLRLESQDLLSNHIDLINTRSLTLTHGGIQRIITKVTSAGSTAGLLYTADDYAAIAYLYVKNTDTTTTNYAYVYDDTTSGDPIILKLAGGDFAWMPLIADKTLRVYGTDAATIVEFGIFGTDQ